MVLFLAGTMWLVNNRIQKQLETEHQLDLRNTVSLFSTNFARRTENLNRQYTTIANRQELIALADKFTVPDDDPETSRRTMQSYFDDQQFPAGSVVIFVGPTNQWLAGTTNAAFTNASAALVKDALETRAAQGRMVQVNDSLLDVIAIPTIRADDNSLLGALVVGFAMDDATAQQLKSPESQIVFIAHDRIVASTLSDKGLNPSLLREYHSRLENRSEEATFILQNDHYAALAGHFPDLRNDADAGYLLLSSYEQSWREFQQTQHVLIFFSLAALAAGAVIVYLLVSRVTEPLRLLRDSAEAVGRGDFSRRIDIHSKDELGELAAVFNQMTGNLQKSLAQLEKTVEILRATQAQLSHSEKLSAVGEFVAGVAHELNNPLTALIGYSELLQMGSVNEEQRDSLQRISSSAERCHKIVQSLLSFARQHPPERKLASVNTLVDGVIEILIYELRTNNIRVEKNLSPTLPRLLLDPHQVQQVFLNIVNNARQAIEAHRASGLIRITTIATGQKVRIIFEDDGPGISEENLAKIFNPFFTTKPVGKGTGLGLSLSYGIIQEHGGTITAASKPGVGTTFVIELPITNQPETGAAEAASAARPEFGQGHGRKVLIVDDEADILDLVGKILRPQGYSVQTAPEGEAALRELAGAKFDLIVSDWKMPGVNGQQLYLRLLERDPEAARRMVFMTGDVLSEKTEKFLSEHKKICLPKPFSIHDFQKVVNEMFRQSGQPQMDTDQHR